MVFKGKLLKGYRIYGSNDKVTMIDLPNVEERKVGKWIEVDKSELGTVWKCSECGRNIVTHSIDNAKLSDYPYCHCGAEMKGDENE